MEPKQFYENLRNDREKVQTLVEGLKAGGFEVYATGSSLLHHNYNDIDLVIKPKEGMTSGDIESQLEKAVGSIDGLGINKPNHATHVSGTVAGDGNLDYFALLDNPNDVLKYFESLTEDEYANSKISDRRELNINGTKIDISVSNKPFELNPEAKYVKL